jgi:hypothetical protein
MVGCRIKIPWVLLIRVGGNPGPGPSLLAPVSSEWVGWSRKTPPCYHVLNYEDNYDKELVENEFCFARTMSATRHIWFLYCSNCSHTMCCSAERVELADGSRKKGVVEGRGTVCVMSSDTNYKFVPVMVDNALYVQSTPNIFFKVILCSDRCHGMWSNSGTKQWKFLFVYQKWHEASHCEKKSLYYLQDSCWRMLILWMSEGSSRSRTKLLL